LLRCAADGHSDIPRLGIFRALNQIVCALRFFYGVTLGQDTVPERHIAAHLA
jgi:hypothetical protein